MTSVHPWLGKEIGNGMAELPVLGSNHCQAESSRTHLRWENKLASLCLKDGSKVEKVLLDVCSTLSSPRVTLCVEGFLFQR